MDRHLISSPQLQTSAICDEVVQLKIELQGNTRRIPELDGLRGLAILLVLIWHYGHDANSALGHLWLYYLKNATLLFWSGVDLFFVLSGFLIGGILLDARNSPNYFKAFLYSPSLPHHSYLCDSRRDVLFMHGCRRSWPNCGQRLVIRTDRPVVRLRNIYAKHPVRDRGAGFTYLAWDHVVLGGRGTILPDTAGRRMVCSSTTAPLCARHCNFGCSSIADLSEPQLFPWQPCEFLPHALSCRRTTTRRGGCTSGPESVNLGVVKKPAPAARHGLHRAARWASLLYPF